MYKDHQEGRDLEFRSGVLRASGNTRIGRRMMAGEPVPGRGLSLPRLRKAGVAVVQRLAAGDGRTWAARSWARRRYPQRLRGEPVHHLVNRSDYVGD
jgi:hypothetical protein